MRPSSPTLPPTGPLMRPPNDPVPKRRRFGDSSAPSPSPSASPSPYPPSTFPTLSATAPLPNNHHQHSTNFLPPSFPTASPASTTSPSDLFPTLPFPQIPSIPNLPLQTFPPHRYNPPFLPSHLANPPRAAQKRPAPSSPPKPPRRRPTPNGMHHHRNPSASTATPSTSATATSTSRTLASIGPIVDALALLPDTSPIIAALAQVLSPQTPGAPLPRHTPRQRILAFRGFPPSSNPNFHALLVLSKVDLDILAWIFTVSKHGRKDDVARRILSSLVAPLRYRTPPPTRRPPSLIANTSRSAHPPANSPAHPPHTAAALQRVIARQHAINSSQPPRNRANMPGLSPARTNPNARGDFLLKHLEQQLQGRRHAPTGISGSAGAGTGYTAVGTGSAGVGQTRISAAQNRNRQVRDLVHEVLNGYDFAVGENPFNKPMHAPLGTNRNYVVFSSMQLSRGNSDPVLMFPTPSPIDPNVRPEIRGGDVQIHLRCLKVEAEKPKNEWKQAWPFPASCRVNGHMVTLNQAQRYTTGKLAGLDTATNISPYLRRYKPTSNETNRVTLRRQSSTATPASGQFVLFAQEILVYSGETMTKSVHEASDKYWVEYRRLREEKGTLSPSTSKFEMARQGVMQFLTDPDGLTVSSMKVSLRCPLALTRIITPVKGKRCQHVQCFDLVNFLEYSRRSSKFDCPVCNKNTAYPAMLVISPYIEHALEKYKDCDEVEIFQDGSMVPVERKQTGVASDDEDDGRSGAQANGTSHGGSKPAEVVDLTLDSDDDDAHTPPAIRAEEIASILHDTAPSIPDQVVGPVGQESVVGDGVATGIEDTVMQSVEDEQQEGNEIGHVDQELDFTFRADFAPVPWGDGQVGEELVPAPVRLPQTSNGQDNWPVDVIAIDSD